VTYFKASSSVPLDDEGAAECRTRVMDNHILIAQAFYDELLPILNKQYATPPQHIWNELLPVDVALIEKNIALQNQNYSLKVPNYQLTPSRQNIARLFDCFLQMRQIKSSHVDLGEFGSLGLMLEGPSSAGKTQFFREMLHLFGFVDAFSNDEVHPKRFYDLSKIPAISSSGETLTVQDVLLKAFHEGALVLIDEFNTCFFQFKTLLTVLLTGVDLSNAPANIPGFGVLATQNGGHMPGRLSIDEAVKARFLKIRVPEYTPHELLTIVQHYCTFEENFLRCIVNEFTELTTDSRGDNHPTLRNLLAFIDYLNRVGMRNDIAGRKRALEDAEEDQPQAKYARFGFFSRPKTSSIAASSSPIMDWSYPNEELPDQNLPNVDWNTDPLNWSDSAPENSLMDFDTLLTDPWSFI
jgi:hypothetical protein